MQAAQSKNIDAKSFWQNHFSRFKESGLSRSHYCQQNTISYDSFTYWIRKFDLQQSEQKEMPENPKQFLPLQIKPAFQMPEPCAPFSLKFKNGCLLQIYNEEALSIILEKML